MESIMSSKTEKNILVFFIIASVIIICIALYFFVIKNPKYMMMYVLSDTNNTLITNVRNQTALLSFLDKGLVIQGSAKYLYKTNGTMSIQVPKKENRKTVYTNVIKPSIDTYLNNIDFYINKNNSNSQDILKFTLPDYQKTYNIYQNDGIIALDCEDQDKFVELNRLDFNVDMDLSIVSDSFIIMYERAIDSFKKQFQNNDFYYLKEGNKYNICLSLNVEKIKEYVKKSGEALIKDNMFVSAIKDYYKQIYPDVIVDREFLQQEIDKFIEKINSVLVDQEAVIEIVVVTDDILNKKINEIQILMTKQNNIVGKGAITFNNDSINVNYDNNDKIFIFALDKTASGYNVVINDGENVNINLIINSFSANKNIVLSGNLYSNSITGNISTVYIDNKTYDFDVEIVSTNSNKEEILNVQIDSQVIFDNIEEYVPARQLITTEQSNNVIIQYIKEMNEMFKPEQVVQ